MISSWSKVNTSISTFSTTSPQVRQVYPSHPLLTSRISFGLCTLIYKNVTSLMPGNLVHMLDVIGIKFAFSIRFLIRKLTLLEMVEKSLIWHDVGRIEWTLHSLYGFLV